MAFDPLSWAIGYTLTKGLNRFLAHKTLASNLQKAFKQWAKNLPSEAHIYPDSDFATIEQDADPLRQPLLCALRNTLLDNHIPTESQWFDALLEQWRSVPKDNLEEKQRFFGLPEETAQNHLTLLAKALADECAKYDQLFKTGAIDLLRKANGKLDTIDGKVDVLLERVKPEPLPQGPIHNLPYTSIGNLLKGRDDALKALNERLSSSDHTVAAITQVQAVHGLGGVGKTRLAVEYAWFTLQNQKYNAILFVIADSPASIDTNLAALAAPGLLNLPEFNQPNQSITVNAVLRCLASRDGWLLIFDNVDTPEARKYLNQILPHLSSGRIIITSRSSNWPANIADLSIDKLSVPDAVDYLLQTTQNKRTPSKEDNSLAATLSDKLDGLPIALEQAAAYISQRHISFQTYLNEFESSRKEILSWHRPELTNYPTPVLAVWQSSEKQLSAPARAILRLSSLLSPEPIPVSLFESASEKISNAVSLLSFPRKRESSRAGLTPPKSKLDIRGLLAELADYSLVKLTESSFTIHRLVQDSIRLSIPEKSLKPLTQIILDIVNDFLPEEPQPDDVRSWHIYKPIEPHLSVLITRADKLDISSPTGRLMSGLGLYLNTLARFKEAKPLFRRALEIIEKSFGPDHPDFATALNNLALLLKATNRLTKAEPLMRRALKIYKKYLGPNHPDVARGLNNLAELLRETGRYKEAEPIYRRALQIYKKSLGPDHHSVVPVLNNLALLLDSTNRFKEAELLYRQALKISEKSLGSDHPNVAFVLDNLAFLLRATNRLTEAEPLMCRALEIFEKSLGPNHPNVATALNNLAQLLQDTNRLKEAEPLYSRALEIDEKSLGPDHPNVAIRLSNLALLFAATNRKSEAKKLLERAVKIFDDSYGPDHPSTQLVRQNLAQLPKT
jgi:tetratricopeptide (TPR) repeat protein